MYLPFLTAAVLMGATAFSSGVAGHLSHGENGLMKLKSADRKTSAALTFDGASGRVRARSELIQFRSSNRNRLSRWLSSRVLVYGRRRKLESYPKREKDEEEEEKQRNETEAAAYVDYASVKKIFFFPPQRRRGVWQFYRAASARARDTQRAMDIHCGIAKKEKWIPR